MIRFARIALVAATLVTRAAAAQTIETPVPFDSAGRVMTISQALASRLALAAPEWPVTGGFAEARLYDAGAGAFVLAVQLTDRRVARYPLGASGRDRLRIAVSNAMAAAGHVADSAARSVSAPARSAFVRNQMILSALLYGPALSSLANDGKTGVSLYLLSTGASYFYLSSLSGRVTVTRAQNHLATDGALRGAGFSQLVIGASGAHPSDDARAASILIGGIGGAFAGYFHGKGMTDAEAHAASSASTAAGLTALGLFGTLGGFDGANAEEAVQGVALGGGIVGYALGPRYPRRATYTVTEGDIGVVRMTGILGAVVASIPVVDNDNSAVASGLLTTGYVAGLVLGDRLLAKPVDHTETESRLVQLGAIAGGLIGAIPPVLSESETGAFWAGSISVGAILGAVAAENGVKPARARAVATRSASMSRSAATWTFSPSGVALAASRTRGNHSILTIRF